nr:unnamed protein product [Digitaria exilis]
MELLGMIRHYKKEIDDILRAVYDDHEDGGSDGDDLYVTSLRFYVLRKHGYAVPSGNISSDDVNTLLTLYDATHLTVHGEDILDNIIAFNKSRLRSLMKTNLESDLLEEIRVTLETTLFRRVERVEARHFISVYEKKATRDNTILEFAKLDYNLVQVVYCNKLKELTIWWKDLRSRVDLTFSRDRNVICCTDKVVEELKVKNNKHAEVVREMALHVAKSYHAEVTWRDEHYVPADVDEHLQISLGSIAAMQTVVLAFVSLGDVATREAIDWAMTYPDIVRGVTVIARIMNDIMPHEREQASDHMESTVQTCMKQYGVTVEEAIEKLNVIVEKAWMDMIQECLDQKYPMLLLEKVVSFAQSIDFFYKSEDLYTLPWNLKDTLTSMYAKFI